MSNKMSDKKTPKFLFVISAILAATFALPAQSTYIPEPHVHGNYTMSSSVHNMVAEVRNPEIIVNQNQAKQLYPYALASMWAHSYKLKRSDPKKNHWNEVRLQQEGLKPLTASDIPASAQTLFKPKTGRFEDQSSGLQARGFTYTDIKTNSKTLILAFAGTDFEATYRSVATMTASLRISWGYEPEILEDAANLCKNLKESNKYNDIVLTGSSLGGAVAQYASLECGSPAIVFNTLALPENLRQKAAHAGSLINKKPVDEIIQTHEETLILSEVEGEVLNNEETWGNYFLQNLLPCGMEVWVIPSASPSAGTNSRHWAPAVVDALEKQAGYDFEDAPSP